MPRNDEGFEVLTSFAKGKFIKYSPYWAVAFGLTLLFGGFKAWGNYLSIPTGISTLFEAYLIGIEYGIGLSFLVGLVGGLMIENLLSRFRCWQIISEEVYAVLSNLLKHTTFIFAALSVGYYILSNQFGYPLEPSVFTGLLGIAVAIAFGYRKVIKTIRAD